VSIAYSAEIVARPAQRVELVPACCKKASDARAVASLSLHLLSLMATLLIAIYDSIIITMLTHKKFERDPGFGANRTCSNPALATTEIDPPWPKAEEIAW
jgi:hypothetical protein